MIERNHHFLLFLQRIRIRIKFLDLKHCSELFSIQNKVSNNLHLQSNRQKLKYIFIIQFQHPYLEGGTNIYLWGFID